MPLKSNTLTLLFFFFFFFFTSFFTQSSSSSIYDALVSHGLPMGLLPKGVRDYDLHSDGRFVARIDEACDAIFESRFRFEKVITGRIEIGKISEVAGISAQELFLWFPVKGVRVDLPSSGLIYFDVGVVFKQFPVYLFDSPPDCVVGLRTPDRRQGKSIIQNFVNKEEARDSVLTRKNLIITKNQENKKKKMSLTSN